MSAQHIINNKHVRETFGSLPKSTRLHKGAAELAAHGIVSVMPVCTHAASKVLAQHLFHAGRAKPSMGIADALTAMAESLGADVHGYYGPAEQHVSDNVPVALYLAQLRREAGVEERKAKRLEKEAKEKGPGHSKKAAEEDREEEKADREIAEAVKKMVIEKSSPEGGRAMKDVPAKFFLKQLRREAAVEDRKAKKLEKEAKVPEKVKEALREEEKREAEAEATEAITKQIKEMGGSWLSQWAGQDPVPVKQPKGGNFLRKAIHHVTPDFNHHGGAILGGTPLGGAMLAGASLGGKKTRGGAVLGGAVLGGKARATSLYSALK